MKRFRCKTVGPGMARVLVIDDDQLFLNLMTRALEQNGREVERAMDGATGEHKFMKGNYDAVVCDIVMPDQEGVQTIKHMRTSRPNVAIVAISGGLSFGHMDNVDVLEIAEKFGADITLKKPFELPEFASAVEQALSMRNMPNASRRPDAPSLGQTLDRRPGTGPLGQGSRKPGQRGAPFLF